MKRLYINDTSEISDFMYEKIEDGCESVEFIGFYEDSVAVIKDLLSHEDTNVYQIAIEPEDWDGYDKEYLVTLDDERNIWCEKAYQYEHNRYLESWSDCTLVADDCNSSVLKKICSEEIYEISYEPEEETFNTVTEGCSEYSHISRDKNGKITGFTKSWSNTDKTGTTFYSSYSHYSSNEEAVKTIAKEFGVNI